MEHRTLAVTMKAQCEALQCKKNRPESFLGLGVDQVAITVKLWWRLESIEEELGLVDEVKVEVNPNLSEVVL